MNWLINKIKVWGIGAAVEALDRLEQPLGDKIQDSIDEFRKLDGHGVAILLVDQAQEMLRAYFNLPKPEKKEQLNLIKK